MPGLPSWPLIQKMRKISLLSTIWKTARSSLPASTNLLGALALETASAADIKKETSIAVYGEADESGAILAKQIFLIRYE